MHVTVSSFFTSADVVMLSRVLLASVHIILLDATYNTTEGGGIHAKSTLLSFYYSTFARLFSPMCFPIQQSIYPIWFLECLFLLSQHIIKLDRCLYPQKAFKENKFDPYCSNKLGNKSKIVFAICNFKSL